MLVVLSKTKQLIVLDSKRKFRAVTNKAKLSPYEGCKRYKKKRTIFVVCKESFILFKVTVLASKSGEMAKLREARNVF